MKLSLIERVTHLTGLELNLAILTVIVAWVVFAIWLTPKNKILKQAGPFTWVILGAMALSNFGLIPTKSPLYDSFFEIGIPIAIVMMLLDINIKKIVKLIGWRPFAIWGLGSLGSFGGGMIAAFFFHSDPNLIKAIAGKTAAWIGGAPNWAAVAVSIFHMDDTYFAGSYAAGLIPYVAYIAIVYSLAGTAFVKKFNGWVKPKFSAEEISKGFAEENKKETKMKFSSYSILLLFALCIGVFAVSKGLDQVSGGFPIKMPFLGTTFEIPWMLILTTLALVISSFFKTSSIPATHEFGLAILYISIATYLAKANFLEAGKFAGIVLPPFMIIILFHIFVIVIGAKLLRIGLETTAIASIANVGGFITAPLCAVTYGVPAMVPLAVVWCGLGHAMANYAGWIIGITFL